jgi:hypothetical protein
MPMDISIYNHVIVDRSFDFAIHWRRPEEFLNIFTDHNKL